jgi:hypothetical protein
VDKIEVKSPAVSIIVEKHGVEWDIIQPVNYKADQSYIGQIIHEFKNLEFKNVVSNKPEKHSLFQVDRSGTQFTIYENGAEKVSIIFGKWTEGYSELYARRSNSDDVFLVEGVNNYLLNRSVKDWRDKAIFSTPKENVKEIQYQYGDTVFSIVLKDTSWYIGKDKTRCSVVEGILSSLSNLRADDFIDSTISPKITAMVVCADVQLRFSFNKAANKYYIQSSNSSQWFIQEPWRTNQILKRKKEIIESSKKSA